MCSMVLRDGAVITFALVFAQKLNHWCVIPGIDNDQAVAAGNTAVALTEFGSYIATGMIASASFGGGEGSWLTAIVFFALGQLALIGGFWAQELLLPGSFVAEVARGREGAGVAVAGVLIALGVILRASIAGPFLGWQASLSTFGVYALGGDPVSRGLSRNLHLRVREAASRRGPVPQRGHVLGRRVRSDRPGARHHSAALRSVPCHTKSSPPTERPARHMAILAGHDVRHRLHRLRVRMHSLYRRHLRAGQQRRTILRHDRPHAGVHGLGSFAQQYVRASRPVLPFVCVELLLVMVGGFAPVAMYAAFGFFEHHFQLIQYLIAEGIGFLIGSEVPLQPASTRTSAGCHSRTTWRRFFSGITSAASSGLLIFTKVLMPKVPLNRNELPARCCGSWSPRW